jgi:hypothetical protein
MSRHASFLIRQVLAFIQKQLCWWGNSFKMYLHDTKAIHNKHLSTLHSASASANIMNLINTPPENVVRLTATMSDLDILNDGITNDQMGDYIDEMDLCH